MSRKQGHGSSQHRGKSRQFSLLGLAGILASLAWPRPGAAHQRTTVSIPMRDGRSLAADVYLPGAAGRWPTVLIQTPYDRRLFVLALTLPSGDALLGNPAYAFVVTDWRGFYGSAGAAVPGYDRGLDGYDSVEWIASQAWSDGAVGTWGASALGVIQFMTASKHPPHLKAAVPMVSHLADCYELYFPGGIWARNKNTFVTEHFGLPGVASHPLEDGFWAAVAATAIQPEAIDVPMLHVSGWYDHETALSLDAARTIQLGGGPNARGNQWVLVGPWSHGGLGKLQQGQLSYPAAEGEPSRLAAAFFDHFLSGLQNEFPDRPMVRTFLVNADQWRDAGAWPPESARPARLYLTPAGGLEASPPTEDAPSRSYVSDPADPVPTLFGAILIETNATQGPGDLRPVEAREDVLTFSTPPLDAPLRLEGTAVARLWAECSAVDTDLAVRLTDVFPDGSSMLLVDWARRVSLRDSFATRELLSPGIPVAVEVELPPVAVTFPAGHRLRLLLASANYDRFDVNLQDGSSLSDAPGAHPVTAEVRILLDAAHPSAVDLPVVRDESPRRHLPRAATPR